MQLSGQIWGVIDFGSPPNLEWIQQSSDVFAFPSSVPDSSCACLLQAPAVFTDCTLGTGFVRGARDLHFTIVATARLHNRNDLIRILGIKSEPTSVSDTDLILLAYQKWGQNCGEYLLGEFSFAIWDEHLRHLFCCRDHIGFRPFVYYRQGSRFVFSSDIRCLLRTPGIPRQLNYRKFAGLTVFGGPSQYPEDTFHRGIQSLPGASSLTISAKGSFKHQFWQPTIRPRLVPKRHDEAFDALRELLIEAVECRISDDVPVVAELSGGLDSSAVVSIAARSLEKRGRQLLALTCVVPDESLDIYEDERAFANEFRDWPNIRLEYVTSAGLGPFDSIEDPAQFAVMPIRPGTSYLQTAMDRAAWPLGARLRLRGLLGEMGPSCFADRYLVELALKLRWKELWKQLRDLQQVQHIRPARYLTGQFLNLTLYPRGVRGIPYILLTKDFCRNGRAQSPFLYPWPSERGYQLAMIRRNLRVHSPVKGRSTEDGNWCSYPWLDKRVLEFCLSAPSELKLRNGYRRNLIRQALDGILPKRIQWRITKTPASPDYNLRYNAQLYKASEFVAAIGPKDPIRSVINIEQLAGLLTPVAPHKKDSIASHVVPANIYAICFLRQFSEFRP